MGFHSAPRQSRHYNLDSLPAAANQPRQTERAAQRKEAPVENGENREMEMELHFGCRWGMDRIRQVFRFFVRPATAN